jgi:diaminopimelate epimerase
MTQTRFAKMTGAANDFIVLDNREGVWDAITPEWIQKVCTRRFSVGADGLMLFSKSQTSDFSMRYFNADGSEAGMCGNGGRCIARFGVLLGALPAGREVSFQTPSGQYRALVEGENVLLDLIPPAWFKTDLRLKLKNGERVMDFTEVGVPHAVLFTDQIDREDVLGVGREIRQHAQFQPKGTNVNFCQVVDHHRVRVRTYERGVEDETLACGTGAAAAVLIAARRQRVQSPVQVVTKSNVELEMRFVPQGDGFSRVQQKGEARLVYWGELSPEATAFRLS